MKTWGETSHHPLLCLHDCVDNAAYFDGIIPLLPQNLFIVSIDLPGHGHSSHLSTGIPYRVLDYVTQISRVNEYFKWHNISILGHGLGGVIGLYFSACFPSVVDTLILINPTFNIVNKKQQVNRFKTYADNVLSMEVCNQDRLSMLYKKNAFQKILVWRRSNNLPELNSVLERNVVREQSGFVLSVDHRVLSVEYPVVDENQLSDLFAKVVCRILLITSNQQNVKERTVISDLTLKHTKDKSKNKCKIIAGDHDILLTEPNLMALEISSFLKYLKCSL